MAEASGDYVLLKRLGSGAMGDVYLARPKNPALPSPIVVKRLHTELAGDAMAVRRFRHEGALAALVNSPHVARVYEAGADGDFLFIAMEHIAGWPLSRIIAELQRQRVLPSVSAAVRLIEGAIRGLADLHGAVHPETKEPLGIIHRDVSPKNIMVGEDGRSRLIDLGVGKSTARDWKTRTGLAVGTPGYMPPEQLFAESVDARADIYAIGAVLFELLTLTPHIAHGPVGRMLEDARVAQPRAPSSLRPDLPKALDDIVLRSLALRAEERFPSASAMLDALGGIQPGGRRFRRTELRSSLRHPLDGTFDQDPAVSGIPRGPADEVTSLLSDILWRELEVEKTEVAALIGRAPGRTTQILETLTPFVADTLPSDAHAMATRRAPHVSLLLILLIGAPALIAAGIGIDRVLLRPTSPIADQTMEPVEVAPTPKPLATAREIEPPPARVVVPPKREAPKPPVRASTRSDPPPPARVDCSALLERAREIRKRVPVGSLEEQRASGVIRMIGLELAREALDCTELARDLDGL